MQRHVQKLRSIIGDWGRQGPCSNVNLSASNHSNSLCLLSETVRHATTICCRLADCNGSAPKNLSHGWVDIYKTVLDPYLAWKSTSTGLYVSKS